MSQLFKIVGLMLKDTYRPSANARKGSRLAVYIVLGLLYLFFEVSLVMQLYSFAPHVEQLGCLPELLTSIMVMGLSIVAMMGIMPMLSLLYFSKDSEFFLGLPISPSEVYFAKLITVFISQLILISLIVLPALVAVGVALSMGVFYYTVMLFAVVILPAFPLIVLSIVCLPFMYLMRFFKNRGGAASVVAMIVFVVFFFLYMLMVYNAQEMPELNEESEIIAALLPSILNTAKPFFPLLAINRFATFTNLAGLSRGVSLAVNFLIFAITAAALFFVALLISRKAYFCAVASQLENVRKSAGGETHQNRKSVFVALMSREWKELARTPIFAMQCFAGLIIAPIFLIIFGISDGGGINGEFFSALDGSSQVYFMWLIITVFLQVFLSINIGAATAISREGKSFYISKLLPVPFEVQLRVKVLFYNIIYWIDITLCVIIGVIILGLETWWLALLAWLYLVVYNYGFTVVSILLDLSGPKLDWKSYREIVKNSRNAMLPALLGIFVAMVMGALMIYGFISTYSRGAGHFAVVQTMTIATAVVLVLSVFLRSFLYSRANKYVERTEV